MQKAIAFDVYGTVVDPLAIADHLKLLIGDRAYRFARLWREKQLEYWFRRGLMRAYRPFSVCTSEALLYTETVLGVVLTQQSRSMLIEAYRHLPPFPEAAAGLASIKRGGHVLAAFSNGEKEVVGSFCWRMQAFCHSWTILSAWTRSKPSNQTRPPTRMPFAVLVNAPTELGSSLAIRGTSLERKTQDCTPHGSDAARRLYSTPGALNPSLWCRI